MAVRLKDGLYLGLSIQQASDSSFLRSNKVHRVICVGDVKRVPIQWPEDLEIYPFCWNVDKDLTEAKRMVTFVNRGHPLGQATLIVPASNEDMFQQMSFQCVVIYFIVNFKWPTERATKFVRDRVPSYRAPYQFKKRLQKRQPSLVKLKVQRNPNEIQLLENTLRNMQIQSLKDPSSPPPAPQSSTTAEEKHLQLQVSQFGIVTLQVQKETETYRNNLEKKVSWIDDPRRVENNRLIIRSPFSKTPLPERPKGSSYDSLIVEEESKQAGPITVTPILCNASGFTQLKANSNEISFSIPRVDSSRPRLTFISKSAKPEPKLNKKSKNKTVNTQSALSSVQTEKSEQARSKSLPKSKTNSLIQKTKSKAKTKPQGKSNRSKKA